MNEAAVTVEVFSYTSDVDKISSHFLEYVQKVTKMYAPPIKPRTHAKAIHGSRMSFDVHCDDKPEPTSISAQPMLGMRNTD